MNSQNVKSKSQDFCGFLNLGTNVDVNADVQTECAEGHGGISRRLKVVATTVTALALAACGKANAQDAIQSAPEVVQQVKMNIDTPTAEAIQMTELPEVMSYIDKDGKFSFKLCRDAGYDTKGCMKFKREHNQMLIQAENHKQQDSADRITDKMTELQKALN